MSRARRMFRGARGFLQMDTLLGLLLLATIVTCFAGTAHQQARAARALADRRAAARLAEQTLLCLQSGQPTPTPLPEATVAVQPLNDPGLGNWGWVRVTVTYRAQQTELIGPLTPGRPQGGPL